MKAKDWKFDRYIPDAEDVDAQCSAAEAYFKSIGLNTDEVSSFFAGFNRGIAWAIAKQKSKEGQ